MLKKQKDLYKWKGVEEDIISCDEKVKVLNENFLEIKSIVQSSFDDAVLMGCDQKDFKDKIVSLIAEIKFSYKK